MTSPHPRPDPHRPDLAPAARRCDNGVMPIDRHTRATIIRLSIDEELPEWFREACRKVIGDREEVK